MRGLGQRLGVQHSGDAGAHVDERVQGLAVPARVRGW